MFTIQRLHGFSVLLSGTIIGYALLSVDIDLTRVGGDASDIVGFQQAGARCRARLSTSRKVIKRSYRKKPSLRKDSSGGSAVTQAKKALDKISQEMKSLSGRMKSLSSKIKRSGGKCSRNDRRPDCKERAKLLNKHLSLMNKLGKSHGKLGEIYKYRSKTEMEDLQWECRKAGKGGKKHNQKHRIHPPDHFLSPPEEGDPQ